MMDEADFRLNFDAYMEAMSEWENLTQDQRDTVYNFAWQRFQQSELIYSQNPMMISSSYSSQSGIRITADTEIAAFRIGQSFPDEGFFRRLLMTIDRIAASAVRSVTSPSG